jgi:iron(III) transport system permease protein
VALVLLPLIYLVIRALGAGQAGLEYLLSERMLVVIGNSVLLTGAVTLSAAVIGVLFAWLTARTDLPLRRFWLVSGLLTLVIPSYIGAITFIAAFGPRGALQSLLEPLGVQQLPSIYGFWGAWLSITLFTYPYVVLPVRAALMNMDPALEEAAHSMGLRRWQVFRRVTLPQLKPALATGMLLSALYTLSDFGAVALMRYDAFTRVIYIQYTSSFDRNRAAILALVLVVMTIALVLLERRTAAVTRNYRIGTGSQRQIRRLSLGRWRAPALAFCAALVGVGVVIPTLILLSWALQYSGGPQEIALPLWNTVTSSGITALVVGLAALPLALLAVRSASRSGQTLAHIPYLGNVLPGVVVALALVFFAANYLPGLYQTMPVLVLGYATRFLPLSIGATRSALTQINPRVEECGRSLGLRPWQVTLRITAPLARGGMIAGMALVFLSVMKELPTTLLLAPTGFRTFATQIWTASYEARLAQAGLPSLLLVGVSALALYFILRQENNRS